MKTIPFMSFGFFGQSNAALVRRTLMPLQGETKGGLSLLRVVLLIHLLAVIAQATLAGMFLSGSGVALSRHEMTGRAVVGICLLQIAITVLLRVRGECPTWVLISAIAILLAEVLETYSGYRGILVVHVPLAMGIFGGIMRQLFWAVRGTRPAIQTYRKVDL
jgi:hypothetical protein